MIKHKMSSVMNALTKSLIDKSFRNCYPFYSVDLRWLVFPRGNLGTCTSVVTKDLEGNG
jgi:hypothetical protein